MTGIETYISNRKCLHTPFIPAETNHRFQTVSMTNRIELLAQDGGSVLLSVLRVTKTSPATADFLFLIFNWKAFFSSAGYTRIARGDGGGWKREKEGEKVRRVASKHESSFPLEVTHQSTEREKKGLSCCDGLNTNVYFNLQLLLPGLQSASSAGEYF